MAQKWNSPGTFHIGINMAGAVSAGAYTAGVLDFLMEALEQWYAIRSVPNAAVPAHDVSIDVFSGASAGGMCAAIAAVMVQGTFEHITAPQNPSITGTSNRFYESWVNKIDIEPLLQAQDIADGGPVISLLDSTIIDEIADYAIAPVQGTPRPYISPSLTLFLALTNVRGVPFSLRGNAPGSAEENVAYYADLLQFETVKGDASPTSPDAKPLPVGTAGGAWSLLKEAAKATGAFPIFLAPRKLDRIAADYFDSPWASLAVADPQPVSPNWPLQRSDAFPTLNIDGGVTDNDPFELAHDFLAIHNPLAAVDPGTGELANPTDPDKANCAVLTVAPFPADAPFIPDSKYDFAAESGVIGMLPKMFGVLISQSRFLGETLSRVVSGTSFSRFALAPSDADNPGQPALQCGSLSAFGGFFERGFRAHDYQLGRRNCQKFLRDYFCLAAANPVIAAGLNKLGAVERQNAIAGFGSVRDGVLMIPIVPLCGTAAVEVPQPLRATISQARVNNIIDWSVNRLHTVAKPLLKDLIGSGFEDFAVQAALHVLISTWAKNKIKTVIEQQLGPSISG